MPYHVGSSFGDSCELRAGADAEPRGCFNNIYFRVFRSLCMHMDVKAPFGPVPYSGDAQPSVRMIEAEAEVRPMKLGEFCANTSLRASVKGYTLPNLECVSVHVPAGVNTLDAAFDDDPCMHYVRKTPVRTPKLAFFPFRAPCSLLNAHAGTGQYSSMQDARPRIDNITFRAMNTTQLAVNIFSRNINTVDGGDALVQL